LERKALVCNFLAFDVAAKLAHIVVGALVGEVVVAPPIVYSVHAATEKSLIDIMRRLRSFGVQTLPLPAAHALKARVVGFVVARVDHGGEPPTAN
jgi:hypothetical protein